MFTFIDNNYKYIIKGVFFLFLEVSIFYILVTTLPGITIDDYTTAFLLILSLSVINAIFWPIISYFSLGFIVFTLGFGTFLIDGFFLWIISKFIGGFTIGGLALFTIPLLIGLISSLLSIILNINDENSYYYTILKRNLNQTDSKTSDTMGHVFIEIDGLAREILDEAIDKGYMPTVKDYLNDSHRLVTWNTDLSSQTGSSQAGILHGNNNDIPAFRWVEKEHDNKIISSNNLNDAMAIEKRISNNRGLLSQNGASRSNLFSGDAKDCLLTYSNFGDIKKFYTKTWYYLYSDPYNIARILILFMADMVMEVFSRIRHLFTKQYRIHRGLSYFVARAGANVVMREATTASVIGDIYRGQYNIIYATYMGYDEIAHHSGIRDFDSYYALHQIDNQIKRIKHAIDESTRDYQIILLSDHGQSDGPTFKQKYSKTLMQLVEENIPSHMVIHSILHSNDDHFRQAFQIKNYTLLNQKVDNTIESTREKIDDTKEFINETVDNTRYKIHDRVDSTKQHITTTKENINQRIDNTVQKLDNKTDKLKNKTINNIPLNEIKQKATIINSKKPMIERIKQVVNDYDLDIAMDLDDKVIDGVNKIQSVILASGSLGLIYFTDWSNRMTYEQIEDAFPNLIKSLIKHPGIGFLMVKSTIHGTIILSDDNIYYMDDDEYVGDKFLDKYGKNIIQHLKRTDSFKNVPDILVNSTYDAKEDEICSFEELIGSHGGVGGTQQSPFILYPSNWTLNEEIVGAENVYKFFKEHVK